MGKRKIATAAAKPTLAKRKAIRHEWEGVAVAWAQPLGEVRKRRTKFTGGDANEIYGQREILLRKFRMWFGLTREEAERRIDKWG